MVDILTGHTSGAIAACAANDIADITIDDGYHATALKRSYLMKKLRIVAHLVNPTQDAVPVLVLCRGNLTASEVEAGLETAQNPRDSYDETQAWARRIIAMWAPTETIWNDTDQKAIHKWDITESLGGGRGIPFEEEEGWVYGIYNQGVTSFSGSNEVISMLTRYFGAWL